MSVEKRGAERVCGGGVFFANKEGDGGSCGCTRVSRRIVPVVLSDAIILSCSNSRNPLLSSLSQALASGGAFQVLVLTGSESNFLQTDNRISNFGEEHRNRLPGSLGAAMDGRMREHHRIPHDYAGLRGDGLAADTWGPVKMCRCQSRFVRRGRQGAWRRRRGDCARTDADIASIRDDQRRKWR